MSVDGASRYLFFLLPNTEHDPSQSLTSLKKVNEVSDYDFGKCKVDFGKYKSFVCSLDQYWALDGS